MTNCLRTVDKPATDMGESGMGNPGTVSSSVDVDQLIVVIDDLHSVALELGAEAADRLLRVLGFTQDEFPSGAELRSRLREVIQ